MKVHLEMPFAPTLVFPVMTQSLLSMGYFAEKYSFRTILQACHKQDL